MRKYKTKRFSLKKLVPLVSVVLFFVLVWAFLSFNVNPIIIKVSEQKVKGMAVTAVNSAVASVMQESILLPDIVVYDKNNNGEIESVKVNTLVLNYISQQIINISQANLQSLGSAGIGIPIGSLSGVTFLAGRGPVISIKVYPVGAVSQAYHSEFTSAGINQTLHQITMTVNTELSIVMPGINKAISVSTDVFLVENMIIGKVPDTYFNFSSLNKILDLLP